VKAPSGGGRLFPVVRASRPDETSFAGGARGKPKAHPRTSERAVSLTLPRPLPQGRGESVFCSPFEGGPQAGESADCAMRQLLQQARSYSRASTARNARLPGPHPGPPPLGAGAGERKTLLLRVSASPWCA